MVSLLIQDIECMWLPSYLDAEEHVKGKVSLQHVGHPPNYDIKAANGLEIPYIGDAVLDFTVAGVKVPGLRQHDYCGLVDEMFEQPVTATRSVSVVRYGCTTL